MALEGIIAERDRIELRIDHLHHLALVVLERGLGLIEKNHITRRDPFISATRQGGVVSEESP